MTGMAIDAPERFRRQEIGADIEALVHTYYDMLFRLTLSILNDVDEAEDAVQETFIAAVRAIDQFRGQSTIKTWLFTIAINKCRQQMRKRKRRQLLVNAWEAARSFIPQPDRPEEALVRMEMEKNLVQAVAELRDKHRLPIILRYTHNLTASEIARVLGISEGTVYSRLHYARRELRQTLTLEVETPVLK
jgi:RNA polymerase sigma-70 factor (ECF subfamily)